MESIERETDITLEHSTKVEKGIQENLNHYYHDKQEIEYRLMELDKEMDVESYLQIESAALSIAGTILALTVNKKWLVLPLISSVLQLSNIAGKWNKPVRLLSNRPGLRSRSEIEKEKYALKAIRGDFKYLLDVPNAVWNAVNK